MRSAEGVGAAWNTKGRNSVALHTSMGDAALMAMKQLSQIVHRQAAVMGYGDAFFMLTIFYFGLSFLVLLLNKPSPAAVGGDDAAH